MADVSAILPKIEWLWPGWLPRGLITLLVGIPGIGKTSVVLEIARAVVENSHWPDDSPGPKSASNVLWCDTESAQAIAANRVEMWQLPAKRFILPLPDPLGTFCLNDPEHQEMLEVRLRLTQPELIVIDSLSGAHSLDENKANEMKPIIQYIANLAKEYHIGVLAVHHVRKKHIGEDAEIDLDRIRGSSIFHQLFRSIWVMEEIGGKLRLRVGKLNMGERPEPIGVQIHEYGLDFVEPPELKGVPLDNALNFLKTFITTEPQPFRDVVIPTAKESGISQRQLYKAKRILGIASSRKGWFLSSE